jgi:quinol monooxygenase YgiN
MSVTIIGGELVVIDEWESAEAFQNFFTSDPQVPQVTEAVGVQGPPRVEVLQPVEAAGTF